MNYRQLAIQILNMPCEHQERTVTMFVPGVDEYYPANVAFVDDSCDVLDDGHMVIVPEGDSAMNDREVTTLQNVNEFTAEDFNVTPEVYQEMEVAQELGLPVTVDSHAVSFSNYWNITLPSGETVDAIDGYHLAGKEL
jgi:hypothetical protein